MSKKKLSGVLSKWKNAYIGFGNEIVCTVWVLWVKKRFLDHYKLLKSINNGNMSYRNCEDEVIGVLPVILNAWQKITLKYLSLFKLIDSQLNKMINYYNINNRNNKLKLKKFFFQI